MSGAQLDLQVQIAKGERISVNPLHLPVEEVQPIDENISRHRRSP
jgi:hypothetical protein